MEKTVVISVKASRPPAFRPGMQTITKYSGMRDISPKEWRGYFPKNGQSWTEPDRQYLITWWGRDHVMTLAFALGREPWNLQREVSRLRKEGVNIPYLRGNYRR